MSSVRASFVRPCVRRARVSRVRASHVCACVPPARASCGVTTRALSIRHQSTTHPLKSSRPADNDRSRAGRARERDSSMGRDSWKNPTPTPRRDLFVGRARGRACAFCAFCVFVMGYFRLCIRHDGMDRAHVFQERFAHPTRERAHARSARSMVIDLIDSRDGDDADDSGDASSSMSIVGDAARRRERPRRRRRSRRRVSLSRAGDSCARGGDGVRHRARARGANHGVGVVVRHASVERERADGARAGIRGV